MSKGKVCNVTRKLQSIRQRKKIDYYTTLSGDAGGLPILYSTPGNQEMYTSAMYLGPLHQPD